MGLSHTLLSIFVALSEELTDDVTYNFLRNDYPEAK
jgi:hypothetical protein